MAGSSVGSGFSGPNVGHKHGFNRFSLGRLFNIANFTHRSSNQHCEDKHSEASMSRKRNQRTKETMCFPQQPGPSSSNSESNSFCSGQVDMPEHMPEFSKDFVECPLCLFELPRQCYPELSSCNHRACYNCLQQYLKIEITESRINISCPECTEPIHPSDIRMILNDEILLAKYETFMLRRVLVTEPDTRWCPAPDCGYAVIANGCAGCPKLRCERPGCNTFFCYHCKQEWHPNQTCDAARAQRARHHANHPRSSSVSFSQDSMIQTGDDIKPCPCCKVLIIKMDDGSCNHMTCSVCGTEFCWLCMKEISDLHYLSPSGCTFWGKKPWSRKKKILWQLGMLVGAPVGIALIAGIAVPAIIIGIPVWVGRKLHAKYSFPVNNRHRRNAVVTSGVIVSVLVSPILAGIAVGIGVPILLAYVYGVVPISLCRSGGCGVSTSASGVRIEFDEENEIGNLPMSGNFDGASVDTAASQRGVNPSIGEVSLGMSTSLSLGSGSHLDRIGATVRESDRDSASNVALAGSIASASLVAGTHNRLDIQIDGSSNKRFSLSSSHNSETASATVSLSERSANLSLADDASTKALAGSLLGYRDGTAVTPVEVHIDAYSGTESNKELSINGSISEGSTDLIDGTYIRNDFGLLPYHENVPSTRSKFKKSSSKKKTTSFVDDCPPKAADSKNGDSWSGHVHFGDLREGNVAYIDESPCSEVATGTTARGPDPVDYAHEQTMRNLFALYRPAMRTSCVVEMPEPTETAVPQQTGAPVNCRSPINGAKTVSRSVSFCNSCTATHRPCCPEVFNRRNANDEEHRRDKIRIYAKASEECPDPTAALVYRAYADSLACQDLAADSHGCQDLATARASSVDCVVRLQKTGNSTGFGMTYDVKTNLEKNYI